MIQNREEKRRGAPAVSVLFDIHPENEDNHRIGQMIDEFQKVYDADMAECEGFRRKQRRLGAWTDRTLGAGNEISEAAKSTILDEPKLITLGPLASVFFILCDLWKENGGGEDV